MKNLTRTIGLAPSELPKDALIKLIRREHQRISEGVEAYSSQAKARKVGKPRSPSAAALLKKLKEKGITLEQYEALLEMKKKIKELEAKDAGNTT